MLDVDLADRNVPTAVVEVLWLILLRGSPLWDPLRAPAALMDHWNLPHSQSTRCCSPKCWEAKILPLQQTDLYK